MKALFTNLMSTLAFVAALALGGAAHAEGNMGSVDRDKSGDITQEEWDAGFDDETLYSDWDANSDGVIDDDEYGDGLYDIYDTNDDGVWDDEEYGLWYDDAGDAGIWDV